MNLKSNNGFIVGYVLITMLVFTALAIGAFVLSSNKEQTQLELTQELRNEYSNGETAEDAYKEYLGGDVIPIYTANQLKKMGTDEVVYINGKEYYFAEGKIYVLQNNITFDGDFSEIQNKIDNKKVILEKQEYEINVVE